MSEDSDIKATMRAHAFFMREPEDPAAVRARHPPDWFDGTPKPCPGQAEVRYMGQVDVDGDRLYVSRCSHCDKPVPPGLPSDPHTFIPCPPGAEFTFTEGKYIYGIEPGPGDAFGVVCVRDRRRAPGDGARAGSQVMSAPRRTSTVVVHADNTVSYWSTDRRCMARSRADLISPSDLSGLGSQDRLRLIRKFGADMQANGDIRLRGPDAR